MPVYNAMPYLPEAVNSILTQTYRNFTFIIINDGSKDSSADYLNSLNNKCVEVVHQENQGLGAALNTGLSLCKTEFICRMDADDLCLPNRIKAQLDFLRLNEEVGLVGSQICYLGVKGKYKPAPKMPCDHETIYAVLLKAQYPPLCHPSIMCRTSILKEIGGYRINDVGVDWDMYLRFAEKTKLVNLPEILYFYRQHNNQVTVKKLRRQRTHMAYAISCANKRKDSQPEPDINEFLEERRNRSIFRKINEFMDLYALSQYRFAMINILGNHPIKGYTKLTWAAICSPVRALRRIHRTIRSYI